MQTIASRSKDTILLRKFTRALHHGSGTAYLLLKQYPDLPVDSLLIDAALHTYEFDPQCSGSHAALIDELLQLRPNFKELLLTIANRFDSDDALSDWDVAHTYRLLCQNMNLLPEIKPIVHRRFARKHMSESGFGFDGIVHSEGIEGIVFVAETIGKTILADADYWLDDWIIFVFDDKEYFPDLDWRKELNNKAATSPEITAFLNSIKEIENKKPYEASPPQKFKEIEDAIKKNKLLPRFIRIKLTRKEYQRLNQYFLTETRKNSLLTLCRILGRKGADKIIIPKLLKLAATSGNLANQASEVLECFKAKEIRQFAIEKITNSRNAWRYWGLLRKNWHKGDEKLLYALIRRTRSVHHLHTIAMTTKSILRDNPNKLPVEAIICLFRHCKCGYCRHDLVEYMHESGLLPEKILPELRHDGNDEIREMINKEYPCTDKH